MAFNSYSIEGLTHLPVQAQLEWVAKLQATRPPEYLPHTSYELKGTFMAGEPFLLVWIVANQQELAYSRDWRKKAASGIEARLLYVYDWNQIDAWTIGLGAAGAGLLTPAILSTGVVYDWAVEPAGYYPIHKMLLVARRDTENVRGRWRIRRPLQDALPATLAFLKQGRCSGRAPN
jgi:hypothetical protein